MTPSPIDPRNEPDYDTFLYGTEPLPRDTTWAKAKKEKENNERRNDALPRADVSPL